jgi:hypothetical protein
VGVQVPLGQLRIDPIEIAIFIDVELEIDQIAEEIVHNTEQYDVIKDFNLLKIVD